MTKKRSTERVFKICILTLCQEGSEKPFVQLGIYLNERWKDGNSFNPSREVNDFITDQLSSNASKKVQFLDSKTFYGTEKLKEMNKDVVKEFGGENQVLEEKRAVINFPFVVLEYILDEIFTRKSSKITVGIMGGSSLTSLLFDGIFEQPTKHCGSPECEACNEMFGKQESEKAEKSV